MQPAGQSPHPISTVTVQPSPAGATVHEQHAPMTFGSTGPMPAKRGSEARTSSAATSGVVTETVPGEPDGAMEGAIDADGAGELEPDGADDGPAAGVHATA